MSHEQILERWQDDFLGSKIEQSEFRNWLSKEYGEDESSRFTWEDGEELIHKFRETGWWTDTFLDFAYTSESHQLNRLFREQLETNPDPGRYTTVDLAVRFVFDLASVSTYVSVHADATRDFALDVALRQIKESGIQMDEESVEEIEIKVEAWSL